MLSISNRFSSGLVAIAAVVLLAGVLGSEAFGDATLTGNCWSAKIKGRTAEYIPLYESNVWISKNGTGWTGDSFRVGLPPQTNMAYYTFSAPAGTYSLYLDEPLFLYRPKVYTNVVVPSSGTVTLNVEPPMDYSCSFGTNAGGWGDSPWTGYDSPWYQTFLATGTSISGVSFKLAGTSVSQMNISIHIDNGGSITTWPQVGPVRTVGGVGAMNDNWLRYRSGEIPTIAGYRYALKLAGVNGIPDNKYAIWRRLEDGNGYANGQAYNSAGQGQGFDLYAQIFSDSDGTVIPYCSRVHDGGDLAGWAGRWGQTFRAVGSGLAGATLYFAATDSTWHQVGTIKVLAGGPTGAQIGPAKTSWSAAMAAASAFHAASWNPGEIPLTPGQTYYLDFSSSGFNAVKFTSPDNVYPYGAAYQSGNLMSGIDLNMQVVEYADTAPPPPPSITLSRTSFTHSIIRHDSLPNDTFTIANGGSGVLSYSIGTATSWLSVSPTSGISVTEADPITIQYDTATLAPGSYQGVITVSAAGAGNSPRTVVVNLVVSAPPFAACDFDQDGDVDQQDYGRFQTCYSEPNAPPTDPICVGAMLDGNEIVDLDDFAKFMQCYAGPNHLVNTLCAD